MAVFVSPNPQLFSANITTIFRFGKEVKDHISSIDKKSKTEKEGEEEEEEEHGKVSVY